ncbi:MAG TPA: glycosyl hydrolase family 28 protein [Opitutales bacterium]|nr:glycosyl hydrolase family 28 protein [Opitutales bacterium]
MNSSCLRAPLLGLTLFAFALSAASFASEPTPSPAPTVPEVKPDAPLSADATPSKLKHYVITDYGAVGDDTTLNTVAIQKAIDTAAAAGGGVVEVPKGRFYTGALFFKKGVELYLAEDAVLSGSQDIKDFPTQKTRIEGHFTDWPVALINFTQMDHVRVSGQGQLNGNGAPYWAAFRSARGAANLDVPRPRLMLIDRCNDVRIEGISFQDSGFWNLHLYHCRDVHIVGLSINAAAGSPSTDGIDVDSCQEVVISKCQISNNDDDIALKGSKGPFAEQDKDSPPDEDILIEDCTIGNGNGLITCGSEATIVRNVLVRNCIINGRANMVTLKLRPDTPQHYSNITIDGVTATGAGRFLNVAPWTQYFDLQGQPSPERAITNLTIRNVTGSFSMLGSLRGTVGDSITNVTFENINLRVANTALTLGPTENVTLKNFAVNGEWYHLPEPQAAASLPRARGPAPAVTPAAQATVRQTAPAAASSPSASAP